MVAADHADHPDDADEVAITGAGVITPLGDTVATLLDALCGGRRALAPAPEPELEGIAEARIADFDATRYANVRGMRIYNRTTRLGISAGKLALTDAGFGDGAVPSGDLGLIMASTFGHLDTLVEYDRSLVKDGIQRTNPALMPLGLPSSPGAAVALSFSAKAFSITLADDAVSSLDALALGARLLRAGRARVCLVVGAFSPFLQLSLAARRAGMLAVNGDPRVFDRLHGGTAYGEQAAAVVLERMSTARARGARLQALIGAHASTFGAAGGAMHRACSAALARAHLAPAAIGLVSAGANGAPQIDSAEAEGLGQALGVSAAETPVTAVKGHLGEGLDASGLVQGLVALSALRAGKAPAIPGLEEPAVPGLRYLRAPSPVSGRHALVTAASSTGASSAMILSIADGDGG